MVDTGGELVVAGGGLVVDAITVVEVAAVVVSGGFEVGGELVVMAVGDGTVTGTSVVGGNVWVVPVVTGGTNVIVGWVLTGGMKVVSGVGRVVSETPVVIVACGRQPPSGVSTSAAANIPKPNLTTIFNTAGL